MSDNIQNVTQEDIINAIKTCIKVSPLIKPTKTVVNTVYAILNSMFIEDKDYIILQAPTGSGKTIIGFITYFCVQYLYHLKTDNDNSEIESRPAEIDCLAYFLTSSKILQNQISNDIKRFNFNQYLAVLKGSANYECYENENPSKDKDKVYYPDRPCKGLAAAKRSVQFPLCNDICPYRLARQKAAGSSCSVINYAYILNAMRSFNDEESSDEDEEKEFSGRFFEDRNLTICDEAHLIPEIVCNIFNTELTKFIINKTNKKIYEIGSSFGETELISEIKKLLGNCATFFNVKVSNTTQILTYLNNMDLLYSKIIQLKHSITDNESKKHLADLMEKFLPILENKPLIEELILERNQDLFFTSELINDDETYGQTWKHIIKDLSESTMVKKHFLKFINKGLFMSATIGDIGEFAELMGIEEGTYAGLRLPSQFDFDKSPIYLCNSGWLNYKNFDGNIDKVLMDTLKVAEGSEHLKQKGIIHTSTFNISNKFKDLIYRISVNPSRYLFYETADEKEILMQKMSLSNKPYVIVGPSLYEGLDLKDDLGRFNILIKVPYMGLTSYTKRKMERFPFWYKLITIRKIIQAIGRTNRHTNDYSKVYLMDSSFNNIIWDITDGDLLERIKKLQI